ncbi:Protein of unknown function [Pyronema omphalodes CBS 100304]|uniref:Uncharacterized protein n=1 Tax=Pyronema omphalodes (strain CBS 100304) TaxID=1076935 RepID=U4L6K7_PYROM|nr:Protein of unknown function [Pyronema omphalodes CBS 100304]
MLRTEIKFPAPRKRGALILQSALLPTTCKIHELPSHVHTAPLVISAHPSSEVISSPHLPAASGSLWVIRL